jgi:trk system potassium uptake protein TrkH
MVIGSMSPVRLLLGGYLLIICLSFVLLSIPMMQARPIASLDTLFIATSAVSTTGLTTISVSDSYTFAGELIILLLIQIGGLGYMTIGSFIILGVRKSVSSVEENLLKSDFSIPAHFNVNSFIKSTLVFSLLLESIGAVALYFIFLDAGTENPLWNAIFHSISAFCTAGFSLFNDSLLAFRDNFWMNAVIAILSYAGAIGFIVFTDAWQRLTGQKQELTYTSKIILQFTLVVSLSGAAIIYISEPTTRVLNQDERLLAALFQSMTALSTVGFNTIATDGLSTSVIFLTILLMLMGASPSGTGGGVKSTTITAVYAEMVSILRGVDKVVFSKREIPEYRQRLATANLAFYVIILCIGIYLLTTTEAAALYEIIFEATSALSTVGLSTGLTGELTNLGKIIVILLMFVGRVGPLSFGAALFATEDEGVSTSEKHEAEEPEATAEEGDLAI